MKKVLKVIFISIATIIILVFATLLIAPSIVKNYVVNHSEEFVGRKIFIENVSLNPLNFVINIDKFALYESDGKTPFVAFDKFRINVDPLKIVTKTAAVSEIYLNGLYVRAVQNGDKFNFTDILEHFAPADSTADTIAVDTTSSDSATAFNAAEIANTLPVAVSIKNIVFEKGNIIYEDEKVGSKFHLEDFSINIPAVYLSNKSTDIGVGFKFTDGGNLAVKVNANMATNDFNVQVDLEKFALACGKPYMKDFIDFKDFSGFLNTHIQVDGNLNDVMASDVKGTVALDSIVLTETSGQTIGVKHVGVGIARANLNENDFHIDSVIVDGAFAHLDLYKGGKTNIDVLLAPMNKKNAAPEPDSSSVNEATPVAAANEENSDSTEASPAPAKKLKAVIDKLLVHNTKVTANDNTITKPFHYTVSSISVNGSNINFDTPCAVNVSAVFPGGGSLSVKYNGAINNLGTMDAYISVKNLALKNFSNYSHHYTGYPLSAGTMAFISENKIRNFELDSKNVIDIYNLDVSDKDSKAKPEYTVPMKVGLYILKDKDDKIQFNVPVTGNLKDPKFSVGKIIWQTVMNLIVKVALSPLKLVGNLADSGASALGLDLGKNDEVAIDVTKKTFTSEQYAKAIKMLDVIKQDRKLALVFTQFYNPGKSVKEMKEHKLKTEYYKQKQGKNVLNELDEQSITEIKDSDEEFKSFSREHGSSIDVASLKKELASLAKQRNADLLKVLRQQSGVTSKNVKVITAPASDLNGYKGKSMYKVSIDVQ